MQKIISKNDGASLIEIVATITIVSICLILIYNILNFNVRQNVVNQEKSINANIANSTLNYIKNTEYEIIQNHLMTNNNGWYAEITVNNCNSLFNDDIVCYSTLAPIINNKKYNENNLYIYLLPYNPDNLVTYTALTLDDYVEAIDPNDYNENNYPFIVRIIVVVKSSINPKYDYLLEGVTTNE